MVSFYGGDDKAWLMACEGDREALVDAFMWASTEEGYEFWQRECHAIGPMSPELKERIRYLYVEWKLIGDTDDREGGDG